MVRSAFFSLSIHLFYYLSLVYAQGVVNHCVCSSNISQFSDIHYWQTVSIFLNSCVLDFHQTCLCVHSCFPFRYFLVHTFLNSLAWVFLHLQNQLVFFRCCFIYFFQPHLIQLFFLHYIVSLSACGLEL